MRAHLLGRFEHAERVAQPTGNGRESIMAQWQTILGRARRLGTHPALLLLALTLAVAGCKPPPEEDPDPAMVDRVGLVAISQAGDNELPTGQATFTALDAPHPASDLTGPFGAEFGSCQVDSLRSAPSDSVGSTDLNQTALNAGPIHLHSKNAAWGEIRQDANGTFTLDATGPLPAAPITLSLEPSGAFPGFNEIVVDSAKAPLVELSGTTQDGLITPATTFSWSPNGSRGAEGLTPTQETALLLVGIGGETIFSCLIHDSPGTFSFPEETRAELEAAGFKNGTLVSVGRLSTTEERSGSAVLLVGVLRLTSQGTGE